MMIENYEESVELNHNPNWPYIPSHTCRVLIISGSVSGKIDVLPNLIKHQPPDTNKIYMSKVHLNQSINQ